MAYNQSSYDASKKYKAAKIKRVPLDMQVDDYNKLLDAANNAGEKVNTYIKKAVQERMERDAARGYGSGETSDAEK